MKNRLVAILSSRGVFLHEIAEIVYTIQCPHCQGINLEQCVEAVEDVISKREVQYAILTGLSLDILAEKEMLLPELQSIIAQDDPLYGVDEVLGLGITNIYGTIGLTNFGYLDKLKLGVIGRLHNAKANQINTFLDDLVAGIAAAASAKLAHQLKQI